MNWREEDHPRDAGGMFTEKENGVKSFSEVRQDYERAVNRAIEVYSDNPGEDKAMHGIGGKINKKTPAEKIASVHIDFTKDNILPELNEETLKDIGLNENKKVLFRKDSIERNMIRHFDLSETDLNNIVAEALYNSVETFVAHKTKPYFHLAAFVESEVSKKLKIGVVLLDIEKTKEYFEIGHVHFVRGSTYESLKDKGK